MARKPMVTRTIVTTKVNVLCLDIETAEPCNITVSVPRIYKEDKKLFKVIESRIASDYAESLKPVHIVDKEELETLYGMTEDDFIKSAQVLDPATRQVAE